jgi:hypothetical protein
MTPREVQGLESLAMAYGGSLTTNPRTGLKEAGFLDNILPTLAGAALTIGTGGAINPWMAAGIVGGVTGAATGNLEKGLMAGLGAYGGAGLGGAFAGTGQAMAGQAAQVGGNQAIGAMGPQSAGFGGLPPAAASNPALTSGINPAAMGSGFPGDPANFVTNTPTVGFGSAPPTGFEAASQGVQALMEPAGRSEFMKQVGGIGGLATKGLAAAGPALLAGEEPAPISSTPGMVRPYTYDPGRQTDQPGFQYRTGAPGESTAEQSYFTPSFTALTPYVPGSGSEAEKEDERRRMGVMGLAAGSQGPVRMLRGGGDATSDSMDGMIDGEEPVKLATGEVVIDGRAVSEIGNGDNEAGAKKIEAAIERIHRIRQKAKRGKPSSADKTFASMIA